MPAVILDEVFLDHVNPPFHPERVERLRALFPVVGRLSGRLERLDPVSADLALLERVHSKNHLARVDSFSRSSRHLDHDTYTSPASFEVARLAAGSVVALARAIALGEHDSGFVLARPPGHHAEADRAMGFCLINSIAVGARAILDEGLARRIAIVDFDVHHGNGTQSIFEDSAAVLYISSHRYPFYPGTGHSSETGWGAGSGFTVNFPLSGGKDDAFYLALYDQLVRPLLLEYRPDLVLVSAGYDTHERDPLGGMLMTSRGLAELARILVEASREVCGGRILFVLEGGYDLTALAESVGGTLEVLLDQTPARPAPITSGEFATYRETARAALSRYWKCFR